ncbi:hypothetical protein D5W64_12245 [Salmonella enterica subsp. enterica serovar Saintpaul]|nr:hypothetical protein [Salmonella enterica subsp. enterica serovar Saintpaul]
MKRKAERIMLGGESNADCILFNHTYISGTTQDVDGNYPEIPDCEIRFHLGTRPVILHNNTSDCPIDLSLTEYVGKLELIANMVNQLLTHMEENPTENFLVREFLNPYKTEGRLFGGTLLLHYSYKYKNITLDIADCSVKNRKAFSKEQFLSFADKLLYLIEQAVHHVQEIRKDMKI